MSSYANITPDYKIFNTTNGAADFVLSNGEITIAGVTYQIIYNGVKDTNGGILADVAATAAQWTVDSGVPVADTQYSFNIQQMINGIMVERVVAFATQASPASGSVATGFESVVDSYIANGVFQLASSTPSTNVLTIVSSAVNPFFAVAGGVNVTLTNTVPGVRARGIGSDLLAAGVVDTFNGTLPESASVYDQIRIDFELVRMGSGFQDNRTQQRSLIILMKNGISNLAALQTAINTAFAGTLDTSGASANIEQVALQ